MQIKKVAVLGSGVMGADIAAHLANAGIPSYLFDIVPVDLSKLKPVSLFDISLTKLITPANYTDDEAKLKECDWIIEVVVEDLKIKQQVYTLIEKHRRADAIISSNTSGIPLRELVSGRSDGFVKNFLITHFFNPVRYMKLVEIVGSDRTDPQIIAFMEEFLEEKLGKGVVRAHDTPTFIANRIGIFSFMNVVHRALEMGLSVEAVDKITGPATGRPKSATFRTADLAGLDTIIHVARNNFEKIQDEGRNTLKLPAVMEEMLANKWLGEKSQQGFYKKTNDATGKRVILSLDLKTGTYREQEKVRYESLGQAKNIEDVGERIKAVITANDEAGRFAWLCLRDSLLYTLNHVAEIADDIVSVDNAMVWGFNWELGPFATLDAIGAKAFAERVQKDGLNVPPLLKTVLSEGEGSFYSRKNREFFDSKTKSYKPVPTCPTHLVIKTLKEEGRVIKGNAGASLIDLGDGVLNVEFHTKMNAIDSDIGEMLNAALDLIETTKDYQGLVIANDAANFSAGANLMLLWMESQQKNWENIERLSKGFQDTTQRMRFCPKPVVVAPSGLAIGGGCEVVMGGGFVRAHVESYIGLVEVGAGIVPAGGGCKNLLLNIEANLKKKGPGGPFPKVQRAFETIGFATVATSSLKALKIGYLPGGERTEMTMARDRLLHDAKQDVLTRAKTYQPPKERDDILLPGVGGKMALLSAIEGFYVQGKISDHDRLIADKLAHVLTGGNLPTQAFVNEQHILDLEREAFLSLCGEEKSQARMQNLLMTGKPLRN